ncbi:MAG TPA: hypothetical protein VGP82_10490, partial [Ktedonobacterales bacterium]|nr:hypothetical protein [Ktedonobacterales bacterium]
MEPVDLTQVPLVDNHCHGLYRAQSPMDVAAWRQLFTESSDPGMRRDHVATTLFYRRLIHEMAAFYECAAEEEAILAARNGQTGSDVAAALMQESNFDALITDQGYPPPELLLPDERTAALANCRVVPILRVELLMQRLIAEHEAMED